MAFENIRIEHGNFAVGITGSEFYTIDHETARLIKKSSSGTIIFSYFLDTPTSEVQALKFDGVYFWALERQGSTAFRIRKWKIGADDLVRVAGEFDYTSDFINNYDTYSFGVEFYKDDLGNQALSGTNTIVVSLGDKVRTGDRLVIGPSTAVGFENTYSETVVINKVGLTLIVSPPLNTSFSPNDDIFFTRTFFVFSDKAPADPSNGSLYRFNAFTGSIVSTNTNNLFYKVRAAVFFANYLMFVRGGEIIWLDPESQEVFKSQAIDNLTQNRSEYHETFDLAGFSNTLYRLEMEKTFLNGSSEYQTEEWDEFNYNTSSIVPEVYFIVVKAEPPIIHRSVVGLTPQSAIKVTVLDQFRTPVFNRLVQLTSTGGSLSPTQDNTNANGEISSTYTANSTIGEITIQATVI